MDELNQVMRVRREKLGKLREQGLDPYPNKYQANAFAARLLSKYDSIETGEHVEDRKFRLAGRIMSKRGHGKASFGHLMDRTGRIQFYARKDVLGDDLYELYKELDIGDIVALEGIVFKTRTGEVTLRVEGLTLLSKSLRPLPEKWHGLTDVETRYRQRYADLIINPQVREVFRKRVAIIKEIRSFLDEKDFLEVETPILQSIAGGAAARPFITHHNALSMDLYLRVSPELYLKRLIVGGFDRVYEINRNFRNEGIDLNHNPEFTLLEVYQAFTNCEGVMDLCERLIVSVAEKVCGSLSFETGNGVIDLTPPFERMSIEQAIIKYLGTDFTAPELKDRVRDKIEGELTQDQLKMLIFEELVEEHLIQPVFITDYPASLCPLAKAKADDPATAERFELYFNAMEIANAYSELNNPVLQKEHFEEQIRQATPKEEYTPAVDRDYVRALEYGMPPAGGLGIGIDRLVMLLTGCRSIREVILFPHMRSETF